MAEPFGHDERLKKYKLRQYAREPTTRDSPAGLGYLTCPKQLSDRGAQSRRCKLRRYIERDYDCVFLPLI